MPLGLSAWHYPLPREVRRDGRGVGIEVEHLPRAFDDPGQSPRIVEVNLPAERRGRSERRDFHNAAVAGDRDGSAIA
jgi:hypothetical protein